MQTIIKILSAIIISSILSISNLYTYADTTDSIDLEIKSEIKSEISTLKSSALDSFKIKVLKDQNLVLENGVWYTYVFSKYMSAWKWVIPTSLDLKIAWIDTNKNLLVIDEENGLSFVKEYKKVKLISDEIISDISNKKEFLTQLADDKKYLHNDTDETFKSLKSETIELTSGLSTSRKIAAIYNYILENTSYSKVFDTNNKVIFSGIYTYENKEGVCTWYSKLALYMLSFAEIENVEVIRWTVINVENFTSVWHAWFKIWDLYFDATFDDPTSAKATKTFSQYKYFGLPKDLFYADRYEYGTMPKELETTSLSYRQELVKSSLKSLATKYSAKNYNLLKGISNEVSLVN